jgi:hypothetical protein
MFLDAGGDSEAQFIFLIGSTLITDAASRVILENGARAANVFWRVGSSATLGSGSSMVGTIVAQASITLNDGVSVVGRLHALTGAVTIIGGELIAPTDNVCPGTCCSEFDDCSITDKTSCGNGDFTLGATECTLATCTTTGACCLRNGDGCVSATPDECASTYDYFLGLGTTCSSEEVCGPLGTCCDGGACNELQFRAECPDSFEDVQTCEERQTPCNAPLGACYNTDCLDCTVTTEADCGPAGVFSVGETCEGATCGSCCIGGNICLSPYTALLCAKDDGVYSSQTCDNRSECSDGGAGILRHHQRVALPHHAIRSCPTPTPATPGPSPTPTYASNCRPKLGCACVNCVDQCDFQVGEPLSMPADCSGQLAANLPGLLLPADTYVPDNCIAAPAAVTTCKALRAKACELKVAEQRNGTVEPHDTLTSADLTDSRLYSSKQHEVYRIFTSEIIVNIRLIARGTASQQLESQSGLPIVYLISTKDDCADPVVISPIEFQDFNTVEIPVRFTFAVPCPGEYLLVYSFLVGNNLQPRIFNTSPALVTDEARAALGCINYGILFAERTPTCPLAICNLRGCRDARDCTQSRSCNACHHAFNRCIVGVPSDSCDYKEPERDVCADATDNTPCVRSVAPDTDFSFSRCFIGACQAHACVSSTSEFFACDCKCRADCTTDIECDDNDPTTIDRCYEGVCVVRPRLGSDTVIPEACNKYSDLLNPAQPIVSQCSPTHSPGLTGVIKENSVVVAAISTSSQAAPVVVDILCTAIDGEICSKTATPICVRLVDGQQVQFQCTEPQAPLALAQSRLLESGAVDTTECAARALDAAELAYTESAFDVFGAFDATNHRTAPLCGADIEASRVAVSIDAHGTTLNKCCSADLPALASTCLDGARILHASGHELFDRAWTALDRGTRALQRGAATNALQESCCAALYYAALAAACGRRSAADAYQLGRGARVVRIDAEQHVGAQCVLFDDGHLDGDLNDFVAEQRTVEVYDVAGHLRAINVHVLPLARGGGYKSSYLLSVRGSTLGVLDRGATAACSARTRALMHESYDPAEIAAQLGARTGVPAGAFVGIARHTTTRDTTLPLGVRHTECATFGGSNDVPYCPLESANVAVLIADLRSTLPPGRHDTLERLLGDVVTTTFTNTQSGTRRVRATFGVSATVALPRRGTTSTGSGELRFVLSNDDCGAAVVLPPTEEAVPAEPMALTVPASACGSWRWTAEGHKLIQRPSATDRICRGGDNGGIEQCTSAAESSNVCTATGGVCSDAPRTAGVPYEFAFEHFAKCTECRTAAQCRDSPSCAKSHCCTDQVLQWYNYPKIDQLYVARDTIAELEGARVETADKKKK